MKTKLSAMLLMGSMLAAPAFASTELAGVVQSNNGGTVVVGAEGRFYAVPANSVFLLNQQRVDPRGLQPGMPVQVYLESSLRSIEINGGNYQQNYQYWGPNDNYNYNRPPYWR